jgi:STE24 endopeptidase
MADSQDLLRRAKRYSTRKYFLIILDTVYLISLLLVFLASGLSKNLYLWLLKFTTQNNLLIPLYLLTVLLIYYLLNLPINFYSSYFLERKFCLSRQRITDWTLDQIKSVVLGYIISLIIVVAFYYTLARYPNHWWLVISIFWILFSLILAKLTPVIIIPLFFRYKRLSDDVLRNRILDLAEKMKIKILDCFEIDLSKKTLKANAAFVGIGRTRRVILADTLKDKYNYDEIEVILAHEFAHYRLRHLLKLILVNSSAIILSFYLVFKTHKYTLSLFGLSSLSDIVALPLVVLYFILFGIIMQPFQNSLSRGLERGADRLALKITGLKDAFISMMDKLALQNLADRSPHPIIKFFFFDHPPIDERIHMAKSL